MPTPKTRPAQSNPYDVLPDIPTYAERYQHDQQRADIFKALAHPVRIQIVELLQGTEVSVGALQDQLEIPQPTISQHLATLRRAGLVTVRRHKPTRASFYRLTNAPHTLQLLHLTSQITPVHAIVLQS